MAKARKKKNSRKKNSATIGTFRGKGAQISLCMIVKNEEKFLPGCLESVQGLVHEMVVVDTGSSDTTKQIAQNFGAAVYEYEWQNDFAAARNFALSKCSNPWILYLDADERLPSEYHQKITKQLATSKADAYYLKVYSPVKGVLGDVPHFQAYPRLFKKLPGVRFEGKIHEQITPSLKRLHARMTQLDVTITHLGYAQEDEILQHKIERNLNYLRQQVAEEPENSYAWYQLGQTLLIDGQKEAGLSYLEKALKLGTLPQNLTATALLMIANEHFKHKAYDLAISFTDRALNIAPKQRLGYFLKSECYAHQFNWTDALSWLQKMEKYSQLPFSDISIEKTFEPYLIAQRLGLYHFNLAYYPEAMKHLTSYFSDAPDIRFSFLQKWTTAWQSVGSPEADAEKLLVMMKERIDKTDQPLEATKLLAGVAEVIGDRHLFKYYLEKALKMNPNDAMMLFYLGSLEMENANFASADQYFTKALQENDKVWEIHYNLAVSKIKQQAYLEAIHVLENALLIFPQKKNTTERLLAGLYAKIGDFNKVLAQLNGAVVAE